MRFSVHLSFGNFSELLIQSKSIFFSDIYCLDQVYVIGGHLIPSFQNAQLGFLLSHQVQEHDLNGAVGLRHWLY